MRAVTEQELVRGLAVGDFVVSLDRDYYVERGIVRGVDAKAARYRFARRAGDGARSRVFYLPATGNDIGRLLFTPDHQLDGLAVVPVDTLRRYWVSAVRVTFRGGWAFLPVVYMQGNTFGDHIFDVSPGLPTRATVEDEGARTVVRLAFDDPVYHFLRIGADFFPDALDGWYRSTLSLAFDNATGAVDVSYDVALSHSAFHHNGFYFTSVDMKAERYDVHIEGAERPLNVRRDWPPYRYARIEEDGGVALVEHGRTADRRYDEGPYYTRATLDSLGASLWIASDDDTVTLDLGNYEDLVYRDRYMDMFGVQFPRNAIVANYTQFGETEPRVAAFLSYTGFGMGWIPALLFGGDYHMRYRVIPGRPDAVVSDVASGGRRRPHSSLTPSAAGRFAVVAAVDAVARARTRPAWWRRALARLTPGDSRASTRALDAEVRGQWEAETWADWRTRWLAREWVDWPHYAGRGDVFQRARLVWETLRVARCLDRDDSRGVSQSATAGWREGIEPLVLERSRRPGAAGSVCSVQEALGLPYALAAWFELQRAGRERPSSEAVTAVVRRALTPVGEGAYSGSARVVSAVDAAGAVSGVYALLIARQGGWSLPVAMEDDIVARVERVVGSLDTASLSDAFPEAYALALPEWLDVVERLRPDVVTALSARAASRGTIPWYAVRAPAHFGDEPVVTFPQTVYGMDDLRSACRTRRGLAVEPERGLSLYGRALVRAHE